MNNPQISIFLNNNNIKEKHENKDDYLNLKKFEKFKPKNIQKFENQPFLRNAEHKVKSILSNILCEMEVENDQNHRKIKLLREKLSTKKIKLRKSNLKVINFNSDIKSKSDLNDSNINSKVNNKNKVSDFSINKSLISSNAKSHKNILISDKKKKKSKIKVSKKNMSLEKKQKIIEQGPKYDYSYTNYNNNIKRNSKTNSNHRNDIFNEKESSKNSLLKDKNISYRNSNTNSNSNSILKTYTGTNLNMKKLLIKNISLTKDKIHALKNIGNKYDLPHILEPNKISRKSFFNRLQSIDLNKYKKVLHYDLSLKNLQEQIKNSIILRPEELHSAQRVKNKLLKEKGTNRKESKFSTKSMFQSLSKKNLIENEKCRDSKHSSFIDNNKKSKEKNINKILSNQKLVILKNSNFKNDDIGIESSLQENSNNNLFNNAALSSENKLNFLKEKYRIFTHKKLIYDSLDDEEIEDEIYDLFYIGPEDNFILIFDFIILFLTLYTFISFPFYLAHNLTFCRENYFSFNIFLNLFIEIVYILDFIFGFFRAYYNFEEQLINNNYQIIKNYLYSWFIFDLLSAIPVNSIIKFNETKCNQIIKVHYYNYVLNNINYLFLCNRLLKIFKCLSCNQAYNFIVKKLNDFKYFNQISLFLQIIFIFSIFHFTSCIYIFIGRNSYPNWIFSTKLEEGSFLDIYICSYYILITALTTVGYGDITCYSFKERIFQLILLIVGIVAYSWVISYFSNYVKKTNEQSIEYEKRKLILDEIKLTNPNLSNILYDKILRYLKYKRFHENKDKSIILDCLPLTLKNNLIIEMYKPVINNFIFFKNFQNIDFIVRVILSFRPIFAIKNDILVNEGDFVEDIIFVKKGILAVELPLNIKDPKENKNKYLNNSILKKSAKNFYDTMISSSFNGNEVKNILNQKLNSNINNEIKYNSKTIKDKSIRYVKILNIRANEHFGDVLMFLEKRSPLCVRVKTKTAELFFLKKLDAINISSSYQNIWSSINKKSVFNFRRIEKSIKKIVELYSSFQYIQTKKENIKNKNKRRKSLESFKTKLNLENDKIIRRYISQKNLKANNKFSEFFQNDSSDSSSNSKLNKKTFSKLKINSKRTVNYERLPNIFNIEKSNVNELNNNITYKKKSLFNNNENINFEKRKTNNFNQTNENEDNKNNIKNSIKVNHQLYEINDLAKAEKNINEKSLIKNSSIIRDCFKKGINKKENRSPLINQNQINEIEKEKEKENNDIKEKIEKENREKFIKNKREPINRLKNKYTNNIKNIEQLNSKRRKLSSSFEINNDKDNEKKISHLSFNSSENSHNESNKTPSKFLEINEEIYPGERLDIPRVVENLLKKKINLSTIEMKVKLKIDDDINIKENSKSKILLESNRKLNINDNKNLIKEKCHQKDNFNNDYVNKNNYNKNNKKIELKIDSSIKLEIISIYENINLLSKFKYHKDKILQFKVKNILEKELESQFHFSSSSSCYCLNESKNNLKKKNSKTNLFNISKINRTESVISENLLIRKKRRKSIDFNINNYKNGLISPRKTKKDYNKRRTVILGRNNIYSNILEEKKYKTKLNQSDVEFNNSINRNMPIIKKKTSEEDYMTSSLIKKFTKDKSKRNTIFLTNKDIFRKKKKDNLLFQINLNIQKTNLNLNNPDEFYSNYFQSLLKTKKKNIKGKMRYSSFGENIIALKKMKSMND